MKWFAGRRGCRFVFSCFLCWLARGHSRSRSRPSDFGHDGQTDTHMTVMSLMTPISVSV